jgi:hypothetical protein
VVVLNDTFTRSDTTAGVGLGDIPDGPSWEIVAGEAWQLVSGRAFTSDTRANNPIVVVDAGQYDVDVSTDIGSGGDCLYFRVVDFTNWWRVRSSYYVTSGNYPQTSVGSWSSWSSYYTTSTDETGSYNYQYGYATQEKSSYPASTWVAGSWSGYSIAYQVMQDYGTSTYNPHSPSGIDQSERSYWYGNSGGTVGWWRRERSRTVSSVSSYQTRVRSRSVTQTTGTYNYNVYEIRLEKSVSGTVTSLGSRAGASAKVKVSLTGNDIIWSYWNGSAFVAVTTVTDAEHATATKHGIGRGTSSGSITSLDNFVLDTRNAAPDTPTITSPTNDSSAPSAAPLTITASAYSDADSDAHTSTVLRRTLPTGVRYWDESAQEWSVTEVLNPPVTSVTVAAGWADVGQPASFSIRYIDSFDGKSEFSAPVTLVSLKVIGTSTGVTATAYSSQRKLDRCANGVVWATYWNGTNSTTTSLEFPYSTDGGVTWDANTAGRLGFAGTGTTHTPNSSLFIDEDDFAHLVFKDRSDGYIYYQRGTPNTDRTSWTWSSRQTISTPATYDFPDVVAHREGTGWAVHIVTSYLSGSTNRCYYFQLVLDSAGTVTSSPAGAVLGTYTASAHTFPSIDYSHGKGTKSILGVPDLHVGWSGGSGIGLRYRRAAYSGGVWTWGDERTIDPDLHVPDTTGDYWLLCCFDGTRALLTGFAYDGSTAALVASERDATDSATTARILLDVSTTTEYMSQGSAAYDGDDNLYFIGRNADEAAGSNDLVYRKWTRATNSLGPEIVLDSNTGNPWVTIKRGFSDGRIEFLTTGKSASPYDVSFGALAVNDAPLAPTLVSPVTSANRVAPTFFDFTHNDVDGDAMAAFALVRKRSL